jgi:hypothetical protein
MDAETWELLLAGQLEPEELPNEIGLSALTEMILDLWRCSVAREAEGGVEEWAALLVRDETGALRLMNPVAGTELQALPDYELPPGTEFVGTFHTHPRTDGLAPMPFSAQDYVSAVQLGENLSLLYSHGLLFCLVRTTTTAEEIDPDEAKALFASAGREALHTGVALRTAFWYANFTLCQRYGWTMYLGPLGQPLQEVKFVWTISP